MSYLRAARWVGGLALAMLPLTGGAALDEWYGGWKVIYSGDDSGTCNVIISQASAAQATITATCSSPALGELYGYGSVNASGSFSLGGNLFGVTFTGTIAGNTGSGQWQAAEFDAGGTWSISRLYGTPADGVAAPGFTLAQGIIPESSITIQTTGDLFRRTLYVDLKIEEIFSQSLAASLAEATLYNVYVVALIPNERIGLPASGGTWFVKTPSQAWEGLTYPLKAFMEGVAVSSQDERVRVDILVELNLSSFAGAEIYIGYGTSGEEMIANRRYRGIFDVQP